MTARREQRTELGGRMIWLHPGEDAHELVQEVFGSSAYIPESLAHAAEGERILGYLVEASGVAHLVCKAPNS